MAPSADLVLRRNQKVGEEPAIDPLILIRDRAGEDVGQENEHATNAEREEPIHLSRVRAGAAADPRAVESERAEMLRGKMISNKDVVDDGERDQTFRAVPRQRRVGRKEDSKASGGNEQRNDDESDRLRAQERPICFGEICEPGAGEAMPDPEKRGEAKIEQIERAIFRVGISVAKPENDRREPERAEHPEPVPDRAADPGRGQRSCDGHSGRKCIPRKDRARYRTVASERSSVSGIEPGIG